MSNSSAVLAKQIQNERAARLAVYAETNMFDSIAGRIAAAATSSKLLRMVDPSICLELGRGRITQQQADELYSISDARFDELKLAESK